MVPLEHATGAAIVTMPTVACEFAAAQLPHPFVLLSSAPNRATLALVVGMTKTPRNPVNIEMKVGYDLDVYC